MNWQAIRLSLELAGCTTLILCLVGLPLGYWLAASRQRWKFLVEAVVTLPLVLPPTVLGFYLLVAMSPNSLVGRAYEDLTGERLAFSFPGLLAASVLYSLPFAVRPFVAAFAGVDRRLVEASWCLGVSRSRTFMRVVIPLAWTGILSGIVLCFAHTMGEFGVVYMVGGGIPGQTETISIAIYNDVESSRYIAALQSSLFILGFSFVALAVTYALQRRVWVP
jgi:molybdate transport system permease protein